MSSAKELCTLYPTEPRSSRSVWFYRSSNAPGPVEDFWGELTEDKRSTITTLFQMLLAGTRLKKTRFKKLSGSVWEFKAGNVRLFVENGTKVLVAHGIVKKQKRVPKEDIELAQKRLDDHWRTHV